MDADVTAVAAAAVTINIIIQIAINLFMAFSSGKRSMPSHVYTLTMRRLAAEMNVLRCVATK